jgi:2-iminobutanoate/2-iminopropanoate deaminase
MTRHAIQTNGAPVPVGPYSQAIRSGDTVWCSGQVGLDPTSGDLVDGGVEAQAERALRSLQAVLDAAGLGFDDVVKTTIFLADIGDFAAVNAVYGRFMPDPPPARSTIGVGALPRGARVEIEMVAQRVRTEAISRTPA